MNSNPTNPLLTGLLPLIANPKALALIGVSAAGWAILSLLADHDDEEKLDSDTATDGLEPINQPCETVFETVQPTVREPLETAVSTVPATVHSTDEKPLEGHINSPLATQGGVLLADTEEAKKEMIRQAMSELGKRSAAARAQKKDAMRGS